MRLTKAVDSCAKIFVILSLCSYLLHVGHVRNIGGYTQLTHIWDYTIPRHVRDHRRCCRSAIRRIGPHSSVCLKPWCCVLVDGLLIGRPISLLESLHRSRTRTRWFRTGWISSRIRNGAFNCILPVESIPLDSHPVGQLIISVVGIRRGRRILRHGVRRASHWIRKWRLLLIGRAEWLTLPTHFLRNLTCDATRH